MSAARPSAALPSPSTYAFEKPIGDSVRSGDERIVITGAGGWLGLATLELLHQCLGPALPRRVVCFGSTQRELRLRDGTMVAQFPLEGIASLEPAPTIVLHLAFLTKDRAEAMPEPEYRAANRQLSKRVLDALDAIGTRAVFVASSGAARSAEDPEASAAMRLYGALKLEDERSFAAWAEDGKRAVIARIFNISGPHMNKQGSYALGSFIVAALRERSIAVQASHDVVRGYVAIRELMSLVFALLQKHEPSVVRFDTGGEPMELGAVAETVSTIFGGIPVTRPRRASAGADIYVGNDGSYRELLRQEGISQVPFEQQVVETTAFFADQYGLEGPSGSC
ncbi:MAG: NAD-dependent epimerase/dehydratase family protein [Sphingomicrobium sp.]